MYKDRTEAGLQLARKLECFKGEDAVVLALPRGGIVLGAEVAKALEAPLGLVLVRKIGHPAYSEYAIGAIAEDEKPIYNQKELLGLDGQWLEDTTDAARKINERRRELYYGNDFTPPEIEGKIAILVDDGIATGLTMEAATRAVQNKNTKKVIVAVPVAPADSVNMLKTVADEVIVLDNPENFLGSVGSRYKKFEQVNDEEVRTLLREVNDYVRKTTSKYKYYKKSLNRPGRFL
jgi:putative phosphoribosyl transferase